ncbi:MFS transporter [Bailinhaonella thermotolerans]|uniref:MFS transporter n=1 Tax=Bailinhaonella thermotolerans TaxID=1070861 RepID=A0A3A4BV83_9ACTN|nr:MFS transporter [Bailinhaonella thermotolerans]RJL35498.1 MFS transporter [Bailinhaonella thermotolerans]
MERAQARRNLLILAGTLLLLKSTWFSATAVIPQVRQEWHLTPDSASWLAIAVQWGFVTGAVLSAVFVVSDSVPPIRLIFLSSAGAAGANLLLLLTGSALTGGLARFATGFFIAGVYPPALKLISTWYRDGRGAAVGLLIGALTVSSGAPHLINALGGLNWRTVIVATSVLTLAGGVITLILVREGPYPFPAAVLDPRQAGRILRDRGTRLAVIGYLCHMWELYAMWTWFLLFFSAALRRGGGDDPVLAAYVTFAVFAVGGLANYTGGVLGDRFGRERTAIAMMSVSAACAAFIGLFMGAPLWLLIAVGLVWGYSVVGDSPQFSTLVTELADQSYVGTALTLQMAAGFVLTGATIWLVPAAEQAVGWRWAFAVLAVGPIGGIVAMLRLLRLRARRPPQAASSQA